MAVIGKIRSYSGLLIAIIGIALAAFVLGDFFGNGKNQRRDFNVGKVGSTKISYPDFEQKVAERTDSWKQQTGNPNISARENFQIRQQVWTEMLREIIVGKEIEKLGLAVSNAEMTDLVQGNNPHPYIVQSFTNPQTGMFDVNQVIAFIQNFDMLEPSVKIQWNDLLRLIQQERMTTKYNNLIKASYYVPKALAQRDFDEKNTSFNFRYVFKRYTSIADSAVVLSKADLKKAYDAHKHEYKQEASRDIEYVVFPVFPSFEDMQKIEKEITSLKEELSSLQKEEVETFINSVSDRRYMPRFVKKGELHPQIDSLMFNSPVGTVAGPFNRENGMVVSRLMDVQMRPDSMKASHILIAHQGAFRVDPSVTLTVEQAKEKADSLLQVARRTPARFGELAKQFSTDPSAQMNNGDLDWFADGAMVPEFNEAVVNGKVGDMVVVKTDFGYHVINITGKKAPEKRVSVAEIFLNIEPSDRTYREVLAKASEFAAKAKDYKSFEAEIESQGLSKRVADYVRMMDNVIPGIDNPREIIRWAFSDKTDKGSISSIFDLDNRYIVAAVKEVREEGIPSMEEIKDRVQEIAYREKKAEMFISEFKTAGASNIEQLASKTGLDVQEANAYRFTMLNLPGVGAEPAVVGQASVLAVNTLSAPIKGMGGVFVIVVDERIPAEMPEDMSMTQRQIKNSFNSKVNNELFPALEKKAKVEDNRFLFY